ncbi:MAG: type I-U CRISPR-associated protein Cas8c, partial [Bryobacteraceae bacterium]
MAKASIPVDLFNPGQVFACLGFLEAADVLCGNAEGSFDWAAPTNVRFHIRAATGANPVERVLEFLARATVLSEAPRGSTLGTSKWSVETQYREEGDPFPFPLPDSPATLPAILEEVQTQGGQSPVKIPINHWGEDRRKTSRDNVKFWAGAGGYPGAALARDALDIVRSRCAEAAEDPFSLAAEQSSSFRLDWRRDYVPMEIGFSLNEHGNISTIGYPLVEILAAIGLTHARPLRQRALEYRYGVVAAPDPEAELLDISLLRAAIGGETKLPFPQRTFRMSLDWPGQENQAKCIVRVIEEHG